MRQTNFALALLAAAALTACGGSDSNNSAAPAKPVFAAQITFGDSLSDVGTYAVGTVAALGGGKYTINGNNIAINAALHGKNWTELMAAQMNLAAPCPAVTGLDGSAALGFSVPVVDHPTCFGYAEGGARVTNPVGPGNKLTAPDAIGQLTIPVATQIATHLSRTGGAFKATDVVYVLAGGNDAFALLAGLSAAATKTFFTSLTTQLAAGATNPSTAAAAIGAAIASQSAIPNVSQQQVIGAAVQTAAAQPGNSAVLSAAVYVPMVTKATDAATAYGAANGPALVPAMAQAGAELAALVRDQIIAKGATHVVLLNLPDLAGSPYAKAQSASTQQLVAGMVSGFNIALRVGIDGLDDKVVYVDAYAASQDEVLNPAKYGISNAAVPACGATDSLVCTAGSLIPGDVSHYLFADAVHPAPYGQTLIAKLVADAMVARGWL